MEGDSREPSPELERYREVQRVAARALDEVAGAASAGVTEAELAARVEERLEADGARGFFHKPLVWFGERTAPTTPRTRTDAFPSAKVLEDGMAAIIDAAPLVDGYTADVSVSFACGENATVSRGKVVLAELRMAIPKWVSGGRTARLVCQEVERHVVSAGFASCQKSYLFDALAHRVYRFPPSPLTRCPLLGMSAASILRLFGQAFRAKLPGDAAGWPFWNDSSVADLRPGPGLWSVEPHFARGGVGVKQEELLVIDGRGAWWLADGPGDL